jgi:CRP-like cAMP-binding protein
VNDLLALSEHLPELELAAGETVIEEGSAGGSLYVLVTGQLVVGKSGQSVATIEAPGAMVGEVAVLLGRPASASVKVGRASIIRHALDGRAFLRSDPAIMERVATDLAARLTGATARLADLREQYHGRPDELVLVDLVSQLFSAETPAMSLDSEPESSRPY